MSKNNFFFFNNSKVRLIKFFLAVIRKDGPFVLYRWFFWLSFQLAFLLEFILQVIFIKEGYLANV